MEKSAMIIVNPTAGKEEAISYGERVQEELKQRYPNLLVKRTNGEGDAKKFASQACEEAFDLAGFQHRPLLGIIPLGTVNNLAKAVYDVEAEEKTKFGPLAYGKVIGCFKSIAPEIEIGDGKMHIFAVKNLNISKLIAITPYLMSGSINDSKNIKYFQTESLKIETFGDNEYKSNIDGDEGPKLPLEIKILPRHLRVISKEKS